MLCTLAEIVVCMNTIYVIYGPEGNSFVFPRVPRFPGLGGKLN